MYKFHEEQIHIISELLKIPSFGYYRFLTAKFWFVEFFKYIYIYIYLYIYIEREIVRESTLKLVDNFTYLGSSVSSTETDINRRLAKPWTAIDKLSVIWKSGLTDKMKRSFFPAAIVSILLYGCTTRTLTKRMKKKLDGNYTRVLRAILNKSWRQHPTKQQV